MSLGKRLKQARKAKGLTLENLAKVAESSKSYLSEIENGKEINPSINKIYCLAKNLNVSTDWLIYGKSSVIWQKASIKPEKDGDVWLWDGKTIRCGYTAKGLFFPSFVNIDYTHWAYCQTVEPPKE